MNAHTAFVRALEAEYASRVAAERASGLSDEQAHAHAFEHVKRAGRAALAELHHAGPSVPGTGPIMEPVPGTGANGTTTTNGRGLGPFGASFAFLTAADGPAPALPKGERDD